VGDHPASGHDGGLLDHLRQGGRNLSDGLPYPIFCFAALLPWTFFSTGVQLGANSLVSSQNLLKRVYFPGWRCPSPRSSLDWSTSRSRAWSSPP
jgi:hypothetical protein